MTPRARRSAAVVGAALILATSAPRAVAAPARQPNCANVAIEQVSAFVTEAAVRFGVPESWISAVMRMESGGDRCVISPAGAQGLMQLMPRTYADLKARYGLGHDPFDPHDNILAGAAYLREMFDRFGPSGFLAAYNAGPGRYQDHLLTGRPLARATDAYVTALTPAVAGQTAVVPQPLAPHLPSLFVAVSVTDPAPPPQHGDKTSARPLQGNVADNGLFAVVASPDQPR